MDEREFRILTKHCFCTGKNEVEAQAWLEKCYANIENAAIPSNAKICGWYKEFENAKTDATEHATIDVNNGAATLKKRTEKSPTSDSRLCDICGKVFSRTDALKQHKVIHSAIKPYQCSICPAQFHDKANLKVSKVKQCNKHCTDFHTNQFHTLFLNDIHLVCIFNFRHMKTYTIR